ncbi:MAG: hypothetical protein FWC66_04620 [Oscillospiraceae bacterium]|nr:hypothetical protein [Oscillospiraceae bacterium]
MIDLDYEQKKRIGFTYVLDLIQPTSPYGKEALRHILPASVEQEQSLRMELENIAKIQKILKVSEQAVIKLLEIFQQLRYIRASIEGIGGQMSEVDLFEIKRLLIQLDEIIPIFEEINTDAQLNNITMVQTKQALMILDPEESKIASFHISTKSFPVLATVRNEKKEVEKKLREAIVPEEKKALQAIRTGLVNHEQKEEQKAILWLSQKLEPWRKILLDNIDAIGKLDLTVQKAKLAITYGGCLPKIVEGKIKLTNMSNPQMRSILNQSERQFTPISIEMKAGVTAITGANMGGKSVALKTLALNVLLIHYGFFPFAEEAVCPVFEAIHLISDDLESSDRGLSSFGGEIVKLLEIQNDVCNAETLVLLDEFARGTNPSEGSAIARGVCAYLNKQKAFTVMTTHYEGVAALANAHYQVAGLRKLELDAKALKDMQKTTLGERIAKIASYMDYGLIRVSIDEELPKDAINICRLLSLDKEIVDLIEMHMVL